MSKDKGHLVSGSRAFGEKTQGAQDQASERTGTTTSTSTKKREVDIDDLPRYLGDGVGSIS